MRIGGLVQLDRATGLSLPRFEEYIFTRFKMSHFNWLKNALFVTIK